MAVAEKYRVDRGFKWMGVPYERGDSISRATFLKNKQVGESRLGSMQRTGFISISRSLDGMTKPELVDYGREVGAEVDPNMLKDDLVAAIESEL
jgi:hypothetical protein